MYKEYHLTSKPSRAELIFPFPEAAGNKSSRTTFGRKTASDEQARAKAEAEANVRRMKDIRPGIWSCLQTDESERHRRCNEDFPPIMARRGFSGPAAVSATGSLGCARRRYGLPHGARPPVGGIARGV
ncbi:hypothetical protein BN1200_260024 [Klebsiella variicola]|nr:hypothetical protein BN1200_260024 [Klebsiella variicola]